MFSMDEITSFLEHPLDKSLYTPKKFYSAPKSSPLRVLISQASNKIAFNLIYLICNGHVFGKNQEIIIHLQSSKGVLHHRAIAMELTECGFPCFKGTSVLNICWLHLEYDYRVRLHATSFEVVFSSNPAVAFKNVDFAVVINTFEEISGLHVSRSILHRAFKAVNFIKNIENYASENCKVIFTGPVTKTMTILLGALSTFCSKIRPENISCVTCLDTIISKAVLGKKLKTTTDKIKNVVIWSNTYPDVSNATVRMYPPDDLSLWEKKDIPVVDAVQDDEWIYKTFGLAINKRIIHNDLVTYGKAIAMATAQHLKVIYKGSQSVDEIHSMGVLTPSTEPYGVPVSYGFSYPVFVENGNWRVLENIKVGVPTQINILKTCSNSVEWKISERLKKSLKLADHLELSENQTLRSFLCSSTDDLLKISKWDAKYFITPNPAETIDKVTKTEDPLSRKSIIWAEDNVLRKKLKAPQKSMIKFSKDSLKWSQEDK